MRLTVRTLLAWIDDVLGPVEHGELAHKVAASPVARPLVERIQAAVASPAISAPAAAGRGLADDPNTAAEFLDNVLDADRLAAFERVCIESDLHLADVAGCHRVLAELHRDAAALEPFPDARGLAALAAARAAQSAEAGPLIDLSTPRDRAPPRAAAVEPGGRRGTSWLAWVSAAVALLLLIALGGVLVMLTLGRGGRSRQLAAATGDTSAPAVEQQEDVAAAAEPPPAPPAAPAVAEAVSPPAEEPPPAPAVVPPPAAAMVEPEQPATVAGPPPEPARPSVPAPDAPKPAAGTVPHGEAMAIGGGGVEPRPPIESGAGEVAGDPRDEAPAGGIRLVEAAALARGAATAGGWRSLTPTAPLVDAADRLELVAPLGMYPLLVIDDVTLRLHPGTRVLVSRRGQTAPVIEVVHGRVVVAAAGGDSWPVVVAGGLHGELGVIPGQPVGIDVDAGGPAANDAGGVGHERSAIHAAGAAVVWRQSPPDVAPRPVVGVPAEMMIPAMTALRWDGRDPAAVRPEPCPAPAWMGEAATADRLWRAAADDLVAALAAVAPEAAIDTLRRRAAAGLPEDRGAAAGTLAFLGEPGDLVALLGDEPPRGLNESQWVALEARSVPVVLAWGGPDAEALLAAFRATAPDGATVAALATGDAGAVPLARLLDGLDAGAVVVRRYSILRLRAAADHPAGDDYRGDRDAAARRESVAWWRALVDQGAVRPPARPDTR